VHAFGKPPQIEEVPIPDARTGRDSDLSDRDRGVPHQSPRGRRRLASQVRAPVPGPGL